MSEKFDPKAGKFDPKAENEKYQLQQKAEKPKEDHSNAHEMREMRRPGYTQGRD